MRGNTLFLLLCVCVCGATAFSWPFEDFGWGWNIVTDSPSAPIAQMTFTEGRTFYSFSTKKTYNVPDEVEVMDYSASSLTKTLNVVRNITEYQHAAFSWHNFGFGFFGFFGFHFSHEAGEVDKMLAEGANVLFIAYKQFQFIDMALWPSILDTENSHFQQSINALPAQRDTAEEIQEYREWIELFGTHYFTKGRYGGDIKYYITVESELFKHETEEWVSYQVGLYVTYLDIQFGFDFGRNISKHNISEQFMKYSKAYCRFRPFGDALENCENLTTIGFHDWLDAALDQPVLLPPNLLNITDIFTDDSKRTNMEAAILDYLADPNATEPIESPSFPTPQTPPPSGAASPPSQPPLQYIPGYNIIGMGIDVTKMELSVLPLVSLNMQENGSYPCTPDNQYGPGCWQNPFYPQDKFFIPWNIYLRNTPESNFINGSQIFQSFDDFQQYYSHTTSHHSFFGGSSKTVYHFYEKYFELDSALLYVYQSRSWYELTMPPLPPPQISAKASAVIQQLPAKYDPTNADNLRVYRNAIESLGTHYIYSAMFGGIEQMTMWFHKCLLSTYHVDWVKEQSGWSFFGIIYDNQGHVNYNSKLNANFAEWSEAIVQYTGGSAFQYEPSEFDAWVDTIKDQPIPTTYKLMPIAELIQDSTRAASWTQAVKDYMGGSYNNAITAQNQMSKQDPWTAPSWCKWSN